MTVTELKDLKKGTRVYWRGDAADSGMITETRWDAVTIAWDNGKVVCTENLIRHAESQARQYW